MAEFAVAVQPDAETPPEDWVHCVQTSPGVEVLSNTNGILLVVATEAAAVELCSANDDWIVVEPLIEFDLLMPPTAGIR